MFEITPFSQNDPRWKDKLIGASSQTIATQGCLLADMTGVANGLAALEETPDTLNGLLTIARLYDGADLIPSRVPKVLPGIRFVKFVRYSPYANLAEIDATLAQNKPVIVQVDRSSAPGIQEHWVVLLARVGKDYIMADPWPYPPKTGQMLLQHYGFNGDAADTIKAAVWMDVSPTTPTPEPLTIEQRVKRLEVKVFGT